MKLLPLIILLFSSSLVAEPLQKIRWLTEDVPPYNYVNEKGEITGLYVDILLEMWKLLELDKTSQDIEVVSWARGMKELNKNPRVCLFSMGSTKQRENSFVLLNTDIYTHYTLIAKKDRDFSFQSINDVHQTMQNHSIGVLVEDISYYRFIKTGGKKSLTEPIGTLQRLVKMLATDRVQLIAFAEKPTREVLLQNNLNPEDYKIVLSLGKTFDAFAFNKKVDPKVLKKMQWAYQQLQLSGKIDQIVKKYEHFPKIGE